MEEEKEKLRGRGGLRYDTGSRCIKRARLADVRCSKRTVLELNVSIHRDANSRESKEKSKDLVLIGRSSSLAHENIPIIFLDCIVSNLYTREGSLILRK